MTDQVLTDALEDLLSDTVDVTVLNPQEAVLRALVDVLFTERVGVTVRVLASSSTLKVLRERFLSGIRAADLLDGGLLAFRVQEDLPSTNLFLSRGSASVLIPSSDHIGTPTETDSEFVDALASDITSRWNEADRYDIRSPSYQSLL